MRTITLTRDLSTDHGTFGVITETGERVCLTIERPWLDNQHIISSIPAGSYVARQIPLTMAPHIAKIITDPDIDTVFELSNVLDRSGIFIHPANIYTDVEGCIGLGESRANNIKHGLPGVNNSQATFKAFMERYKDEDELQIIIIAADKEVVQ